MDHRMAALSLGDGWIGRKTQALMAVFAPPAGIRRRPVVSIDHVTARTPARPIGTRMIVRPHEPEQRIMHPGFLQSQKPRVGAIECAKTALGEPAFRFTRRVR